MTKRNGNAVTPTTTALQARVAIFQPSQRPQSLRGEWIDTSYGRCRVSGRLGQRHADVVESLLYCAEKKRSTDDSGVELLVDPARVRRTLSQQYSHQRLWRLLNEIMQAVVEIQTPDFRALGHLIDHVVESPATRRDPLTGRSRNLWRVRVGIVLVALLGDDLSIYRDPSGIAGLTHGITQAVARYVLTHKQEPRGGWHLDTVIKAVAGEDLSGQAIRKARLRVNDEAESLGDVGVIVTENRVHIEKRKGNRD